MNEEEKLEKAKKFLGELLSDTADWSCTDTQHDLKDQFVAILGEKNVPNWILHPCEDEDFVSS